MPIDVGWCKISDVSFLKPYEDIFKDYPDVVGVKEVSEMLGICSKKVYQLIRENKIPVIPCCKPYKMAKLHIIEYILGEHK